MPVPRYLTSTYSYDAARRSGTGPVAIVLLFIIVHIIGPILLSLMQMLIDCRVQIRLWRGWRGLRLQQVK